jgi:signal transduction histidine kinase
VKQIITGHGGRILVDSEEGVGTTFTIYLPVDPRKQEFESS